jgi:putative ABC transport system permease protein
MHELTQNLRLALRTLVKSPGFTAVALATLALGIGANTAIFSVVDAVLLRPLPYPDPSRLVGVFQTLPRQNVSRTGISYLNYSDFAARARSFRELGAIRMHDYTLTGQGEPELVVGGTVTSNVFAMFQVRPLLGRVLSAADDAPEAPPVAVLGERLWRERFASDREIVGKTVSLDKQLSTVVGVLPAAFKTPPGYPPAQLWLPLTQDPVFNDLRQKRGGHYLTVVGRLAPGITIDRAQAELAAVAAGLARQYPKENEGWSVRIFPLSESLVGGVRTALTVLLAAVLLVFLIACANIANLLLARAGARTREVAVRTALGAGRGRLLRQFLTECLVLGLTGGALGVALAFAGMRGLKAWLPPDLPRVEEIKIDGRVLLFSLGASLLAALFFGLAPAWQASGTALSNALREGSAGAGESGGSKRLRHVLVVAETALSFVLLIGAGLLGQSFLRLQEVDLGFRPTHVLTAGLSLPRTQYAKPDQWIDFYRRLVGRLQTEPEVEGVAAALPLPLSGGGLNFGFQIEGRSQEGAGNDLTANYTAVTPDYFRVMGVALLQGRFFTSFDAESAPRVCLISSTFARRFFPDESPIGRRLVFGFREGISRQIVGVVGDVKRDGIAVISRPEMYVPFFQDPWWASYLAVRTSGDPERLAAALRRDIRSLDPTLPIADIQPMTRVVDDSVAQPRLRASLLTLFGATALVLAIIGVYGVISYNVGRRTREVGIRLALGAQRGDVLRLILRQGLGLTAAGLALGLAGALLLTRHLASLLFGIQPIDAPTYLGVAAVLLAAGLVACWIPARRATRVDPVHALRYE